VKGRVEQENFTGKRGTSQEQMEEDLGEDSTVNFSHNGDYSDREGDGSNRNEYGMHRGKGTGTHKDSAQVNGRGSSSPREDIGQYTQEHRQDQTTKGSSSNINRDGESMGFEGSQQGGRRPPNQENNLRRYNVTDLCYNSSSSKNKPISAMFQFNNLQNLVNNTELPTFNTLIWAEILYYKVCTEFQSTHGCSHLLIFSLSQTTMSIILFVSYRFTRQTIQRFSRGGITKMLRLITIGYCFVLI